MGKIIGGIIVALIVIIAVAVGVIYFNLDRVIVASVKEYGSKVTKTDVVLETVDLDIFGGKLALNGFSVGNPAGFEEDHSIRFDTVSVDVNIGGSSDKLIHIREVRVDNPSVIYEVNQTTNNLTAIQENVDAFMKEHGLSGGEKPADDSAGEGPKIIIDNLFVNGGRVSVRAPVLAGQKIESGLPNIHLSDIGKDEGGATPGEVIALLIDQLSGQTMNVLDNLGIGKNLGSLLTNAGDLINKSGIGGAAGKAGDAAKGVTQGATDALGGAGGAVKKLFGD